MNRIDFVYYIERQFPGLDHEKIVKEVARLKQLEKDIDTDMEQLHG